MADYTFYTYATDALTFDGRAFTLASGYDWQTDRNKIEYSDDDGTFNGDENNDNIGDDSNQIGTAYDDQGNVIQSGTVYVQAFAEIEAPDGNLIWLDRIEVDGVHVGYVPTEPLQPGVSYTYFGGGNVGPTAQNGGDNQHQHSFYTSNSVPCLAVGTQVLTPSGWTPVEAIRPGDYVETLDNGPTKIVWGYCETQDLAQVAETSKPIEIKAGALGAGRPRVTLVISPQHRVLIGHAKQAAHLSKAECFVPAKALVGLPGIRAMSGKRRVDWVHLACAGHEIMIAECAYVDTLLLGRSCVSDLPSHARLSLHQVFGHPSRANFQPLNGPAARPCIGYQRARQMMFQPA